MKYLNKVRGRPKAPLAPAADLTADVSIEGGRLALDGRTVNRATEDAIWVALLAIAHMNSHGTAKRRQPRRRRLAKARERKVGVAA